MNEEDLEFTTENEMTEYFVIREYLECLEIKDLVNLLQPKLTFEEKSQILLELQKEHEEMLNER